MMGRSGCSFLLAALLLLSSCGKIVKKDLRNTHGGPDNSDSISYTDEGGNYYSDGQGRRNSDKTAPLRIRLPEWLVFPVIMTSVVLVAVSSVLIKKPGR